MPVIAGVALGLNQPSWQDKLPNLARAGFVLWALGDLTLPAEWNPPTEPLTVVEIESDRPR